MHKLGLATHSFAFPRTRTLLANIRCEAALPKDAG